MEKEYLEWWEEFWLKNLKDFPRSEERMKQGCKEAWHESRKSLWIPVEEELPDKILRQLGNEDDFFTNIVQVKYYYTKNPEEKYVSVARMRNRTWYWIAGGLPVQNNTKIIAWQPLAK